MEKDWSKKVNLLPALKNILQENLTDIQKIFLRPLHIKLALMKHYDEALNKDGACSKYICKKKSRSLSCKIKGSNFCRFSNKAINVRSRLCEYHKQNQKSCMDLLIYSSDKRFFGKQQTSKLRRHFKKQI